MHMEGYDQTNQTLVVREDIVQCKRLQNYAFYAIGIIQIPQLASAHPRAHGTTAYGLYRTRFLGHTFTLRGMA